mmetsp:Transcript_8190/g.10805  ORF Transcript_8190/g.10805 Transcript_8190/m.10805 type:complete len:92 (-) Transcript_8190:84-359(-)
MIRVYERRLDQQIQKYGGHQACLDMQNVGSAVIYVGNQGCDANLAIEYLQMYSFLGNGLLYVSTTMTYIGGIFCDTQIFAEAMELLTRVSQ